MGDVVAPKITHLLIDCKNYKTRKMKNKKLEIFTKYFDNNFGKNGK
jgi:hypothetical protein